jgi:hypothetical protein
MPRDKLLCPYDQPTEQQAPSAMACRWTSAWTSTGVATPRGVTARVAREPRMGGRSSLLPAPVAVGTLGRRSSRERDALVATRRRNGVVGGRTLGLTVHAGEGTFRLVMMRHAKSVPPGSNGLKVLPERPSLIPISRFGCPGALLRGVGWACRITTEP